MVVLFQSTLPNGRSMSMSDVLGEPFSTPVSSKTSNNMQRSSTMPQNSDGENSQGSTPSVFGSISILAGSGMKSLTSSKAANLGFRRGKALLSSALSGFSPQTSKNLSTLRSGLSSAATNLSKVRNLIKRAVVLIFIMGSQFSEVRGNDSFLITSSFL